MSLLELILYYDKSWLILHRFDVGVFDFEDEREVYYLSYKEAKDAIEALKRDLMRKNEASELFGLERDGRFEASLKSIEATFEGIELIPRMRNKAAHLLYYIVKDHPFVDGNKRIGALMFILFLAKNGILYKDNCIRFTPNALATLTLFVAVSDPAQHERVVGVIKEMLK